MIPVLFPMLAEMNVTPEFVVMVAGALATLAVIYSKLNGAKKELVKDIIAQLRADTAAADAGRAPQPFIVAAEKKFATQERVEQLHSQIIPRETLEGDLSRMGAEIGRTDDAVKSLTKIVTDGNQRMLEVIEERFKELDRKRSTSIGNLHEHVTSVRDRVAAVEATTQANVQALHSLDSKIDNLRSNPPRRT